MATPGANRYVKRVDQMPAATGTQALASVAARAFACDAALAGVIAGQAKLRQWPNRATLVNIGAPFEAILLLISGRARMSAYGVDGRVVLVQDFASGDLIGEGALIDDGRSEGEIVATDAVEAGSFATPVFIALMSGHACVAIAVSRLLVARLGSATRRMVAGATLSAVGRVYSELLRLARLSPTDRLSISPAPVLAELARSAQTTRETVSRAISALEKRGIIKRNADALVIVAPHRLEDLIV